MPKNKTSENILAFLSPERSITRFVVGTAALTVIIQVVYDVIQEQYKTIGTIILTFSLLAIVVGTFWYDARRAKTAQEVDVNIKPIQPRQGVIMLVSPRNVDLGVSILKHHADKLKYVWLVATKESQETADQLVTLMHQEWPHIKNHSTFETLVSPDNIESTYEMVNKIYQEWVPAVGLTARDVVSDITGGLKTMTAGMALACLTPERDMEYVFMPSRPADSRPESDSPRLPIEISTRFVGLQ